MIPMYREHLQINKVEENKTRSWPLTIEIQMVNMTPQTWKDVEQKCKWKRSCVSLCVCVCMCSFSSQVVSGEEGNSICGHADLSSRPSRDTWWFCGKEIFLCVLAVWGRSKCLSPVGVSVAELALSSSYIFICRIRESSSCLPKRKLGEAVTLCSVYHK